MESFVTPSQRQKRRRLIQRLEEKPSLFFLILYISVIAIGTLLLMLPIATAGGKHTSLIDAFFISTSALCVTGLSPVVTATHWTLFGKTVILILIQMGGLGIMTATASMSLIIGRRINVTNRKVLMEERGHSGITGIVKMIRFILISTFIIEGIGALLLSFSLVPEFGVKGIWYSIFHAISAFCNAGFDVFGEASLSGFSHNVLVLLVIASLIIVAGIGYTVYLDILGYSKKKRLQLHTKIVLTMTILLLVIGTLLFLLIEWNNPNTLGKLPWYEKITAAFFQSTTVRTAGFFSVDQSMLLPASAIVSIILMFIGGSPTGTAGGIKTTTFIATLYGIDSDIHAASNRTIFHRNLSKEVISRAYTIFVSAVFWCMMISFLLTLTEKADIPYLNLLFETVSAFGTVGLSRNVTPLLSISGKILICITMIFGKLGPITLFYALVKKRKPQKHRAAEEMISVG